MVQIYQQQTTPSGGAAAYQQVNAPTVNNPEAVAEIGMGKTLSNTAATLMDVQNQAQQQALKQQETSGALWATNTVSSANLDWTKNFNAMQSDPKYSNGDGSGFSDDLLNQFDKYSATKIKEAESTNNLAAVKYTKEQMASLKNRLGVQGAEYQEKQRINYNTKQLKSTLDNGFSTIGIDPTQAPTIYNNNLNAIQQSMLPFDQKDALLEANRKGVVEAAASNQITTNPASFKNAIAPSLGKLPQGTIQAKIADAAQAAGNNPLVSLAFAQIESGVNYQAESSVPGSTAKGLYQITDATWKANGGTAANRNDPQAQIEVAQRLQQNNANYLRAHLGHEPTPTQEYMAHFLGAGGAVAAINADPKMSMADVVRQYDPKHADAIIKGNNLEGKSVGQVLSSYDTKMNNAMSKFSTQEAGQPKPFFMNIMTQQEKQHYGALASQVVNQQAQTLRVNLSQQINDHEAQALNGVMPAQPLNQQQFSQMYPNDPGAASVAYQKYTHTLNFGAKVNQLGSTTPAQEQGIIQSLTPVPNTPGYADDAKLQQEYIKAVAAKHELLKKDSFSYVTQNSPVVKQAAMQLQQSNTPENMKMYLDAAVAQQQQQGIMFPKVMSQDQENQTITMMQNLQGNKKAEVVKQLVQQYGSYFPEAAKQLKSNTAFPSGLTAILEAPTSQAIEQASLAADLDRKTLETTIGSKKKDTDTAISDALANYKGSLNQFQQGSKTTLDMQDSIEKIAYSYVAMGRDPSDAAETAVNMFVGNDKFQYLNNNASGSTIRLPNGYNPNQTQRALEFSLDKLNINNVSLNNVQALKNPWYMTDNADGYLNQIKKNSMWMTTDNDKGVALFFMGKNNRPYPVFDKQGNHIYHSFVDLQTAPTVPEYQSNSSDMALGFTHRTLPGER